MIEMIEMIGFSYCVGTFPSAILLSKILGLKDPRTMGSGNPGATNMVRNGGRWVGGLTFLFDALKGALVVYYISLVQGESDAALWGALSVVVGHMFPVWFKFRGGKGVATCIGALGVLMPEAMAFGMFAWALVFKVTKQVFFGSILMPFIVCLWSVLIDQVWLWPLWCIAALVLIRHHQNIKKYWGVA